MLHQNDYKVASLLTRGKKEKEQREKYRRENRCIKCGRKKRKVKRNKCNNIKQYFATCSICRKGQVKSHKKNNKLKPKWKYNPILKEDMHLK